jgi:hypothetical protein
MPQSKVSGTVLIITRQKPQRCRRASRQGSGSDDLTGRCLVGFLGTFLIVSIVAVILTGTAISKPFFLRFRCKSWRWVTPTHLTCDRRLDFGSANVGDGLESCWGEIGNSFELPRRVIARMFSMVIHTIQPFSAILQQLAESHEQICTCGTRHVTRSVTPNH